MKAQWLEAAKDFDWQWRDRASFNTNSPFPVSKDFRSLRSIAVMKRPSDIEKLIAKLDPEAAKIYFDAKHVLETVQDPDSEEFVAAARIVSAFWKKAREQQD